MADIKIVADYSDLKDLRNELSAVQNSAKASAKVFERELSKALDQNAKSAQAYYKSLYEIDKSAKSAYKSAQFMEATFKEQERTVERLSTKYKPLYAASKQYEKALDEISQAHKLGVLTSKQHEDALEALNKEYQDFSNGTAGWSNQFTSGMDRSAKSMNRFGMYAQQTGYQVGDFLVQIQGGTNAFVAFGQQATQLAGLLTGRFVFLGAALGIAIPLITAVGAAWSRSRKDSDKAAEATETLNDKLKSLDATLEDWIMTKKAAAAGMTVDELLGTQGLEDALKEVEDARSKLASIVKAQQATEMMGGQTGLFAWFQAKGAINDATGALAQYVSASERLFQLEQKASDARVRAFSEEYQNLSQQLQLRQMINKYGEDSWRVRQLEQQQQISNYNAQIDKQVKANELTWSQGEALKNSNAELQRQSVSLDDVLTRLGQSTGLINSSTTATGAWESAMSGVRAEISAIISGLSSIGGGMIGNAAKQAEIDALKAGKSIRDAAVAQQSYIKEQEWAQREIGASWWEKQQIASEKFLYQESLRLDTTLEKERALAREREKTSTSSSSGGGAGTSALTLDKRETSLQSLLTQYMPTETEWEKLEQEREKLEVWQQKANQALEAAQIKEREGLEAHNQYKLEIAKRYVDAKSRIDKQEQDLNLSSYESFFGSMATVFAQGNEKALKVSKAFGVAEATVSMWRGAAKALELPYPANLAAWGKVLATGASAIASIKSVTASSSGSSSSASTSSSAAATSTSSSVASATTAATPQAPQMIQLSGLTANSLFSGSQLQELFDAIYEENKDRGYVLSIG